MIFLNSMQGFKLTVSNYLRELKDLFKYKEDTLSETHDLLNCRCAPGIKFQFDDIRISEDSKIFERESQC